MDAGIGHQVGLELGQVHVEGAVKAQGGRVPVLESAIFPRSPGSFFEKKKKKSVRNQVLVGVCVYGY